MLRTGGLPKERFALPVERAHLWNAVRPVRGHVQGAACPVAEPNAFDVAAVMPRSSCRAHQTPQQAPGADADTARTELAAQATKQSLNEIASGEQFDLAVNIIYARLRDLRESLTAASADFAEGRAAMAARRTPRFTGR